MKASDLFIRCLENEGVKYIFGVPGEENADIMISLLDSSITFVVCRHEQGAAFMADAWGRLTGTAVCCLGTLGPGATNLLTGVGDANMDRAPLVVLTGQASTSRMHKESHQVCDLVAIFRECVKWGVSISNPNTIPEIVRKAFRVATTDKFGATHIDLPEDIAKMNTLAQPIPPRPSPRSAARIEAVEEAAAIIRDAKFPIILTGNGTLRNLASDALRALARDNGIPVLNTFMGKGAFPPSDPLCLFTIGLGSRDWPAVAIEDADCVISVGFDMVEYHPKNFNKGNEKQIIHIDQNAAEIDENYRTAAEITGDIKLGLEALNSALSVGFTKPDPALYSKYREQMLADFQEYAEDDGFPVKPQKALWDIRQACDDDAIIFSDVGAHKMWIARYLHSEVPNTIHISNGWCTMGIALPGIIGAKFAYPDRQCVGIAGDGGFMMNVQDFETAVREKKNVVQIVWTDSQYGLIRWKQETAYGKHSHIDFTNPDFMKLAEAFGVAGFKCEKTSELQSILKEALNCGKPALVEIPIDYGMNPKLTASLKQIPAREITDALGKVDLFKGLPLQYRQLMAGTMSERGYSAGDTVFAQGDPGKELFLIYEGEVVVEVDGAEVARLTAGQAFGEMAALSDAPRGATVKATADCRLSCLDGTEFQGLVSTTPTVALALSKVLADRLALTSRG